MARPSKLPRWATTGIIVEPTEAKKDQGWLTSEKPPAQYDNWFKDLTSQWLGFFDSTLGAGYFGDGSDGDAVLDGVAVVSWATLGGSQYTLDRDVYVNDLTIETGASIYAAGFRLFVLGTLTIEVGAAIHCNGFTPVGPSGGNATSTLGSLRNGNAGGGGGDGGTPGGTGGGSTTSSIGGSGGAGGLGDSTGASVPGAAGGTATAPVAAFGGYRSMWTISTGYILGLTAGTTATVTPLQGGAGGGGGHYGANGGDTSKGGGGGGGAGVMVICASVLVLEGTIEANGGFGGNSTVFTGAGFDAGGGGGGGGGGIFLLYGNRSGAGSVQVNGGQGGAGTFPVEDGVPGSDGTIVEQDLSFGTSAGLGPHEESGVGAMSDVGIGDGVDYLDAVFVTPFSATDYEFEFSAYSSAALIVPLTLTQKNTTTMRITPAAPFNGEISWSARKK